MKEEDKSKKRAQTLPKIISNSKEKEAPNGRKSPKKSISMTKTTNILTSLLLLMVFYANPIQSTQIENPTIQSLKKRKKVQKGKQKPLGIQHYPSRRIMYSNSTIILTQRDIFKGNMVPGKYNLISGGNDTTSLAISDFGYIDSGPQHNLSVAEVKDCIYFSLGEVVIYDYVLVISSKSFILFMISQGNNLNFLFEKELTNLNFTQKFQTEANSIFFDGSFSEKIQQQPKFESLEDEGAYVSSNTKAISVSNYSINLVVMVSGIKPENMTFLELSCQPNNLTTCSLEIFNTTTTPHLTFQNINDRKEYIACSSEIQYLKGDPEHRNNYKIARFCPMYRLNWENQTQWQNLIQIFSVDDSVISIPYNSINFIREDRPNNVSILFPMQLQEISILDKHLVLVNQNETFATNFGLVQTNQTIISIGFTSRYPGLQTFSNCFSRYSNYLSCYSENEDNEFKNKFLVEFLSTTENLFKLPPISISVGDDSEFVTIFNDFLVFTSVENKSIVRLVNRESYSTIYKGNFNGSSMVKLQSSSLSIMPKATSMNLGILVLEPPASQEEKGLNLSRKERMKIKGKAEPKNLQIQIVNLHYPYYKIYAAPLQPNQLCLKYVQNCSIKLLQMQNRTTLTTRSEFEVYHVVNGFNNMLPSFDLGTLAYTFVGGEISFFISDLFYGVGRTATVSSQIQTPSLGQKLTMPSEIIDPFSDTEITVMKTFPAEDTVRMFASITEDNEIFIAFIVHTGFNLNYFTFMRESIHFDADRFTIPDSAFSSNINLAGSCTFNRWDLTMAIKYSAEPERIYILVFNTNKKITLIYNVEDSVKCGNFDDQIIYKRNTRWKDIQNRENSTFMIEVDNSVETESQVNIYNVEFFNNGPSSIIFPYLTLNCSLNLANFSNPLASYTKFLDVYLLDKTYLFVEAMVNNQPQLNVFQCSFFYSLIKCRMLGYYIHTNNNMNISVHVDNKTNQFFLVDYTAQEISVFSLLQFVFTTRLNGIELAPIRVMTVSDWFSGDCIVRSAFDEDLPVITATTDGLFALLCYNNIQTLGEATGSIGLFNASFPALMSREMFVNYPQFSIRWPLVHQNGNGLISFYHTESDNNMTMQLSRGTLSFSISHNYVSNSVESPYQNYSLKLHGNNFLEIEQNLMGEVKYSLKIQGEKPILKSKGDSISLSGMARGVIMESALTCNKTTPEYYLTSRSIKKVRCLKSVNASLNHHIELQHRLSTPEMTSLYFGGINDWIQLPDFPSFYIILSEQRISVVEIGPFTSIVAFIDIQSPDKNTIKPICKRFLKIMHEYSKTVVWMICYAESKAEKMFSIFFTIPDYIIQNLSPKTLKDTQDSKSHKREPQRLFSVDSKPQEEVDAHPNNITIQAPLSQRPIPIVPGYSPEFPATPYFNISYTSSTFSPSVSSVMYKALYTANSYEYHNQMFFILDYLVLQTEQEKHYLNIYNYQEQEGQVELELQFSTLSRPESVEMIPTSFLIVPTIELNNRYDFKLLITMEKEDIFNVQICNFTKLLNGTKELEVKKCVLFNIDVKKININQRFLLISDTGIYLYIMDESLLYEFKYIDQEGFNRTNVYKHVSICETNSKKNINRFKDYIIFTCEKTDDDIVKNQLLLFMDNDNNVDSNGNINPVQFLTVSDIESPRSKILSLFSINQNEYMVLSHPQYFLEQYRLNQIVDVSFESNGTSDTSTVFKLQLSNIFETTGIQVELQASGWTKVSSYAVRFSGQHTLQCILVIYFAALFVIHRKITERIKKIEEQKIIARDRREEEMKLYIEKRNKKLYYKPFILG